MIKISLRKNLIYLFLLFFFYFLRRVLVLIIEESFELSDSLIFSFFMCLGQISGGLIIYWYQYSFLQKKNKKDEPSQKILIELIETEREMKIPDNNYKIGLLIFFASFFDLEEFLILNCIIPKIQTLSTTTTLRLSCIMTITSSFTCKYILRFKIFKHQIFSLIIMGICSIINIILEIYFRNEYLSERDFVAYLLVFFHFIFISFTDVIEKYLADYDYINPLKILMTEGIFSFVLSLISSIAIDPLKEITAVYNKLSTSEFILLLFLLLIYTVLSAVVNIYKILCNVLYSPITKSLASYFLISPFIIYHYAVGNDFLINGQADLFYFLISLIFCVIISFFGLIYNEFFILDCCGLSKETYDGIATRAKTIELELIMNKKDEDNEDL